jgi:RNA polymerase-binding transcription factor DksA
MIDTTQYKSKLEDEKTRLEEELSTVARPNESVPGEWEAIQTDTDQEADPNDQAGLLDEYQENRALVDVLNKRYKDITAALARIDDGTYGICSISGKEIESERLDADPAATTCIEFVSNS